MVKKKAGILTFHDADNLGAVLQAYALEHILENECGVSAEIVDYKCKTITETKYPGRQSGLKGLIKFAALSVYYLIKRKAFGKFRKNYLACSERSYSRENISECESLYDFFITGSDQVWNPECSGNDSTYVLNYINDNKKKHAYAASIGNYKFSAKDTEWVDCIKKYKNVSVRESSAAVHLKELGVRDVSVDVDPVLLLSDKQWKAVMSDRLLKQKYVLVYLVLPDVNVMSQAKAYAEKNNCKVISNKHSVEFFLNNSPSDFLSWIYHSECVFTNSFHGTAFSLIFNKPLFADTEMSGNKINHRINDLLTAIDANECSQIKNDCVYNKADKTSVIDEMKADSINYLKKICSNN